MKTKFVIIPEDLVYSTSQKYCGYKMRCIDFCKKQSILDATKEDLSEKITSTEKVKITKFLFSNLENFNNLLKKGETIKEYILRK